MRIIIVALALSGCMATAPTNGVYRKASPDEIAGIKAAMDLALVDSTSARYQWSDMAVFNETRGMCFLVNSKNRMGGYTGWTVAQAKNAGGTWQVAIAPFSKYGLVRAAYIGQCNRMYGRNWNPAFRQHVVDNK